MKRPSFQFYPADWRKDAALQSCSLAAQGLWVNLLCIAHECEPYGHLVVNGRPMVAAQIARLVGISAKEAERLLAELSDSGVLSMTDEGVIFSRRMVRDETIRSNRAEGGKAGSEFGKQGAEHGRKGGRPRKETGDKKPPLEPPLEPPPSSSSSSSSSLLPSSGEEIPPASLVPPAGAGEPTDNPLTTSDLEAEGVGAQHAKDWLKVRRAAKAPLTRTAWDAVKREAALVGMTPAQAVKYAAESNWRGFKAAWVQRDLQQRRASGVEQAGDVFAGAV